MSVLRAFIRWLGGMFRPYEPLVTPTDKAVMDWDSRFFAEFMRKSEVARRNAAND